MHGNHMLIQLITDTARRTFTGALSFSQILSKNLQLSFVC